MNKKEIINNVLSSTKNIIKHGQLSEKVSMELKMMTSLYEYIEVVEDYYTEPEHPDYNNWTDVEGFGYGWAWTRWDKSRWHEMMSKEVERATSRLWRDTESGYYVASENNGIKIFHLIGEYGECRKDVIVSFSNDELDY